LNFSISFANYNTLFFGLVFLFERNKGLLELSLSVMVLQITLITSEVVRLYKLLIVLPLRGNTALRGVPLRDPAKDVNISTKHQRRRSN